MFLRRRPKVELNSVVFEVTPRCNLACRHCYNPYKRPGETPPKHYGYRENQRALKKLLSQAQLKQVTLSGGEPLMAERFLEIVLWLRLKGLPVTLISNGTQGEPKDWEQLVQLGVGLFELPVLGPDAATHDAITQRPGSFEATQATMKLLVERGARVCAAVVVSRMNLDRLESTLDLVAGLGVDSVLLNRVNIGGLGLRHWRELWLEPAQVDDLLVVADRISRRRDLRIVSGVCTPLCAVDPSRHPKVRTPTCSTDPARRPLTMDGSGQLRSCNHSPVILGDLFQQPLSEIVASPELQRWQELVPEKCRDCGRWDDCLGGCRAASEQLGCDLDTVDPLLWSDEELEAKLGKDV
jgi:radical SAM protein with 4Fe4S-binding SPASM domain